MKFLKVLGMIAVVAGTVGFMGCTHRTPEQRAEWMVSKISGKLDLNETQRAKLDAVKNTLLEIRKTQSASRQQHFDDLKKQILAEHMDKLWAKSMVSKHQKMIDDNFEPVFSKLSEFHDSLTKEQKQKAVELIEKFSSHWD